MKSIIQFGAVLLCGLALFACSSTPSGETAKGAEPAPKPSDSKGAYVITMIAKSQNNPVFQAAKVGAEAAAKELTEKMGREIKIDWRTPDKEDGQLQAQAIEAAVNSGSQCVLIACSDAAKVTNAINSAVDKGVPVMTFDSDAPQSKRFAFYGADDMEVGKDILEQLAKLNGGKGNVAILAGNQNAPNLQARVNGVREAMKGYPDMKEVGVFYHIESPQDATAEVQRAMKANPQIDSWAMVGGWPLFATSLLSELKPGDVKIVAVDCLPAQMAYVEKGISPVLLAQPIYDWGYKSVNIIVDKQLNGKDIPVMNKMNLEVINKENLKDWGKKLKDWGFNDVDPKYLQ